MEGTLGPSSGGNSEKCLKGRCPALWTMEGSSAPPFLGSSVLCCKQLSPKNIQKPHSESSREKQVGEGNQKIKALGFL